MVSASDTSKGSVGAVIAVIRLDKHLLNLAVVYQHGVAPGAHAKAQVRLFNQHAHLAGKLAVAVGQQKDLISPDLLAPLEHHKGIVYRDADNFVKHPEL